MNLYEYIQKNKKDYDVYDVDYGACVTVVYIDEETDEYDKFVNNLLKKVEFVNETNLSSSIVANWTKLIKDNYDKFKDFESTYWKKHYEDEDEFIYQWIKELNMYIAGYVDEDFYKVLNSFVETLK